MEETTKELEEDTCPDPQTQSLVVSGRLVLADLVDDDDKDQAADSLLSEHCEERKKKRVDHSQLQTRNHIVAEIVTTDGPDGNYDPSLTSAEKTKWRSTMICGITLQTCCVVGVIGCLLVAIIILVRGVFVSLPLDTGMGGNSSLPFSSVESLTTGRYGDDPTVPSIVSSTTEVASTTTDASFRQALFEELETWIIRTDQDRLPFEDPSSPQSLALDWLSTENITLSEIDDRSKIIGVLERYVLAVLYFATNGPNWTPRHDLKILTEASICEWNDEDSRALSEGPLGIYCKEPLSTVRQILLYEVGLDGTIPWEICLLSELQALSLLSNEMKGSLPTELGDLTAMEFLQVGNNRLTGTIPTELGRLTLLNVVYVYNNSLEGTIPIEIAHLTILANFQAFNNSLHGSLPRELGQLTALTGIGLHLNSLTGTLPTELGQISTLQSFHVYDNMLTGTIPTEFQLTALTGIGLHLNSLTGTLPTELGQINTLQSFHVYDNMLTGTIPTEFAQCTDLKSFALFNNGLTGTVPTELGQLTAMSYLSFCNNSLTGTLPTELGRMKNVQTFNVYKNLLNGTLPTEFARMTLLQAFFAGENLLTGTLPTELAKLTDTSPFGLATGLSALWLNDNHLTGTLPTEFGKLASLVTVHLENNAFTGLVPEEFSQWSNVMNFSFSGSNLNGSVNDVLCSGSKQWGLLQSDCIPSTNDEIEIECGCCTVCCNASGEDCQEMI